MSHFIDKFSSTLAGAACTIDLDDIEKKIRYPVKLCAAFHSGWESYFNTYLWEDYPESHHIG